jgi:predicted small lipoprotein YifL
MRLIPSILAALIALTILSACGTKTSLTLPPAVDNSNKAAIEPRQ